MNIVVLMKQVPDTETEVVINADGKAIDMEDVRWVINPYDELSLEEALLIKEANENCTVTVLIVGTENDKEAIRMAYAMGVDKAVLVNHETDEDAYLATDAFTTAKIIAKALETIPHDLVIAGQRAVDDDNYQVPSFVAKFSGMPMISNVIKQRISGNTLTCEQSLDRGTVVLETKLPALFTTQKGINEPRYPAFRAIMKAKKRLVDERDVDDIGLSKEELGQNGALVTIQSIAYPPKRDQGVVIQGKTPEEKAEKLLKLLKEEAAVI